MEAQLNDVLSPAFCPDELLARCLGKADLMQRILRKFRETFVKDFELLDEAVAHHNAENVALVAHRLKGAAANIGAPTIRDVAANIEIKARQQTLEGAHKMLQVLHSEWHRFSESIGDYV